MINERSVSVLMPVINAEKNIKETCYSILQQSFSDFELIIVDYGSTDNTVEIVRSFTDNRLVFLENKCDLDKALTLGIQAAVGKYLVRMNADDIMHIDRLKIQYNRMESESRIVVCGAFASLFGPNNGNESVDFLNRRGGVVEDPLLRLLKENFVAYPTAMIRKAFLVEKGIDYKEYSEDYKLWFEIAKNGGDFYIETQVLVYHRHLGVNTNAIDGLKRSNRVKTEILYYLISGSKENREILKVLLKAFDKIVKRNLLNSDDVYNVFYKIFQNKIKRA